MSLQDAVVLEPEESRGVMGVASEAVLDELWRGAEAESVGLSRAEFVGALVRVGEKCGYGLGAGVVAGTAEKERFWRGLQGADLALAQACALGREVAWERFVARFKGPLRRAAVAMTRSSGLGEDLADSLYSELYGLKERDGVRASPLASYSGRGSLMGWLRTTLAQRHVDRHRKTGREEPLEDHEPTSESPDVGHPVYEAALEMAVKLVLGGLGAEERFLLSAYFLDGRTLLEIGGLLRVHEATISRRVKRLTGDVTKRLLKELQARGLSKRAAEEALGTDPRDISVNLRNVLQSSGSGTFSEKTGLR
ncbi:RNA polymerase sigma factor [Granulicella tundricola]|uniref:RNA polymerase sigma factor n=1 Tax=Granulicella tundricola TaxID=940615 RepID=UPI0012F97F89|nr:sigma-70 family RNA polymerase sigma factor [Granulicella tundricola]